MVDTGGTTGGPADETAGADETGVSTLELFFDLVFVFAVTQITGVIADDPTASGVAHGVVLFALLWWAWGAYAWLTNTVETRAMPARLVLLGAMAAALVLAVAVPTSFGDGGLAFGLAYLVVLSLHLALFAVAAENPADTRQALRRLAPTNLLAALLLVAGSLAGDRVHEAAFVLAVIVAYVGPYLTGVSGYTVHPRHFAERHGLIVIVALGESIIAIGAGGDEIAVDRALAGTALLAISLVIALWWAYFDADAERYERALTASRGADRARLARDIYSYLHVPLVLGVVLAAVGIHEALVHPREALDPVVGGVLAAGVALFFAGLGAMRLRCGARAGTGHVAIVGLALLVALAAPHLAASASLAVLAVGALGAAVGDRWMSPAEAQPAVPPSR
ncbi:MAG TPA: low temperature requirement protein A [Acidimicrobiales bacterium]|nr:low temperature requirement protein A [Acidimicrobiales bacterium]